ncbi:MAG: hypothetical protein ABW252_00805 [Polyangiales bacterium]
MNKIFILALAFGGLVGCSEQDYAEDESEVLEQSVDGGRTTTTPGLDGSVSVTGGKDGGADAGRADAGRADASTR